ncbi:MAG: glycerol-3-phosphate dehydrogenase, partial [Treponemataceae bacterium]|nr:glycerol-3-phosphate dehydrogenase [Treponemataceae bacterium]
MNAKQVGVIGAGAWGSGLAQALARGGHKVELWAREQDVVDAINNEPENTRY